jgi:RNA polymerase sigma-70 factor (ECF subfamily)
VRAATPRPARERTRAGPIEIANTKSIDCLSMRGCIWGRVGAVGRREELEQLYERYSRGVYRRAVRILGDEESARDATQEVFMRVISAGRSIPAEPTPVAWLYRVTTNLCLNRLRDRSRQKALLASKYAANDAVPPAGETRTVLGDVLDRVPEELQDVAIYFFVDELTYDEIAPLLGVSKRTVSNRLAAFRALVAGLFPEARSAS